MIITNFNIPVKSSWMLLNGRRLDCNPYLSGAFEAKAILEKLSVKKQRLGELTTGYNGGIYNGPQFTRNYVEDPHYGIPFLTSGSMLLTDLSNVGLLRKRDAESSKLRYLKLEEGMILISCSGTIGRMLYTRPDMNNMWSSQDILKVVADKSKILPGYLYSFLSSKFGVPMIIAGTYGAIIQHLEPSHILDLPIPRLTEDIEKTVHNLVHQAAEIRSKALRVLYNSGNQLLKSINLDELKESYNYIKPLTSEIKFSSLRTRFEGAFHSPLALEAEMNVLQSSVPVFQLKDKEVTNQIFKPNIFKRAWVDSSEYGVPFVSGNDIYRINPKPERYISNKFPGIENYLLQKNMVVFQAAGQLNGIFGIPILVNSYLDGMFCADDVFRIVPNTESDAGYIYAFLRTNYGQRLIKRQAYGYSIPRVVAEHVGQVVIPWAKEEVRVKIGEPVVKAWEDLATAIQLETNAVELVERVIEND